MVYKNGCLALALSLLMGGIPHFLGTYQRSVQAKPLRAAEQTGQMLLEQCRQELTLKKFEIALDTCQRSLELARKEKNKSRIAKASVNLGIAYHSLNNHEQAIASLQAGIEQAQSNQDQRTTAIAQKSLAEVYDALGQSQKSVVLRQQSNPYFEQRKRGENLLQQGSQHYKAGQIKDAIASWTNARMVYQKIGDHTEELLILKTIGQQLNADRNFSEGLKYNQQTLKLAKANKNSRTIADSLVNIGISHAGLEEYEIAIKWYQKAIAAAKTLQYPELEVGALNNIGQAYLLLRQPDKAMPVVQQALMMARQIKNPNLERSALHKLALLFQLQGQAQDAIRLYTEYLELIRPLGDRPAEVDTLILIGTAYRSLNDNTQALQFFQKAFQLAQQSEQPGMAANALINIGKVYTVLENHPQAIENYEQARQQYQEAKDPRGELETLGQLGSLYIRLQDFQKANDIHQNAFRLMPQLQGTPEAAQILEQMSVVRARFDNPGTVIGLHLMNLLRSQQQGDREGEAIALSNLGKFYLALSDFNKSREYYQQSLSILQDLKDRQGEGIVLDAIGSTYSNQGQFEKGLPYTQKAVAIFKQAQNKPGEAITLNNLGWSYERLGRLQEAEKVLRQSIQLYTEIREGNLSEHQVSLFEEQARTYRMLQRVLVAQGETDAALEVSELGRARAFVNLLEGQLDDSGEVGSLSPPNLAQIKKLAREQNATLVQYTIMQDSFLKHNLSPTDESELYIWVISPKGEVKFEVLDLRALREQKSSLAQMIRESRDFLGSRTRTNRANVALVPTSTKKADQTRNLKKLHQLLIEPIQSYLPSDPEEHIIFIPHEALLLTPFAALLNHNNEPLIKNHTLRTAPSIQILQQTHQLDQQAEQRGRSDQALVLGNPKMPKTLSADYQSLEQLLPLPGAEREAKAIASLLKTSAITGTQATKATVIPQMQQANMIHFATHGILDDARGLGSAIALAPDPSRPDVDDQGHINGLLTAKEILELKLNADLAVLSACDTGLGKITGDGVIGLSRSFIAAGVPSVMVSLWAVPDAPTAELMTKFYQNLNEKQLDKAQALRQAMLTTMKKHPDPKDWAAFTLIGEAD